METQTATIPQKATIPKSRTAAEPPAHTASVLPSGDWYVDPARSRVEFHTRAWFGLSPVLGRFDRFAGKLHVDESGRATGDLRIETASIDTRIKKRDAHLRGTEFFHAKAHPELIFDLTGLEPTGDGYEVVGTLRIRDTALPIRTGATVTSTDSEMRIEARFPVDHHSAGLGWAKPGLIRKFVDADVSLRLTRDAV